MAGQAAITVAACSQRFQNLVVGQLCFSFCASIHSCATGAPHFGRPAYVGSEKTRDCCYVAEWLRVVCHGHRDSDHGRRRYLALWSYSKLWTTLKDSGQILSRDERGTMVRYCDVLLAASSSLRVEAHGLGRRSWHLIPKHRQLLEMVASAADTGLNPAWHWCWGDEDFVGRIARLAKSCHMLTQSRSCMKRYALRYRLLLSHHTFP